MDKLPNDIILIIFNNINDIQSLFNFIILNKNINNLLKLKFKKYFIEYTLNNDYLLFYKILNNNEFNMIYLNNLLIKAINKRLTVWSCKQNGFSDMIYIFELMFTGCRLNNQLIKKHNLIKEHFYCYFYNDILKCIVYNDRIKTINNINNCNNLTSLKTNFNYYKKGDYKNKVYYNLVTSSKRLKN